MRRLLLVGCLLLLVGVLVACAGGGGGDSTPDWAQSGASQPSTGDPAAGDGRAPSVPTPTPTPSTNYRRLSVTAADGVRLAGLFYPPDAIPAPGILLLHMAERQKEDWVFLASRLQEAGYGVLAVDLRGHGESQGEMDWAAMPDDALRSWAALLAQPEVDSARCAVVGAGLGANLALVTAAADPSVTAMVMLSPGLEDHGVGTEDAISAYGDRPALIVASQDDLSAAESALTLHELAQTPPVLVLYPSAGHGTEMLARQPDLIPLIVSWLTAQFSP